MKDIQGYYRGKCNSCECEEYREPPTDSDAATDKPRRLRCEYCNHTPVEHVWIIELGECTKCGADNCDKYESDEKNSYTDCGYCGCSASNHKGANKLRRNTPAAAMTTTITPRVDGSGKPVQLAQFGLCKRPGCNYPKRADNGTVHDYCSRTCALADQSSAFQSSLPSRPTQGQPSHGSLTTTTSPPTAAQGSGQPMTSSPSSGPTLCKNCNRNLPNTGYSWCSICYNVYEAQAPKKS